MFDLKLANGFLSALLAASAVAVIFYSVLITWFTAANRLSVLFHAQTELNKAEEEERKKTN